MFKRGKIVPEELIYQPNEIGNSIYRFKHECHLRTISNLTTELSSLGLTNLENTTTEPTIFPVPCHVVTEQRKELEKPRCLKKKHFHLNATSSCVGDLYLCRYLSGGYTFQFICH